MIYLVEISKKFYGDDHLIYLLVTVSLYFFFKEKLNSQLVCVMYNNVLCYHNIIFSPFDPSTALLVLL